MTISELDLEVGHLSLDALDKLVEAFEIWSGVEGLGTASGWGRWHWWRVSVERDRRLVGVRAVPEQPEVVLLSDLAEAELLTIQDDFTAIALNTDLPDLHSWCMTLVSLIVIERQRRDGQPNGDLTAMEEAWRASKRRDTTADDGYDPTLGDLRGLPTWRDISGPPDDPDETV